MKTQTWQVQSLLRNAEPGMLARRSGDRLLALTAGLEPDDTIELRLASSGDGQVRITMTIASAIPDLDEMVAWVWADIGVLADAKAPGRPTPGRCEELVPAVRFARPNMWAGLSDDPDPRGQALDPRTDVWPSAYANGGLELLRALRSVRAELRVHLAPARDAAAQLVIHEARRSTAARDPETFDRYTGTPVSARLLVGYEGYLSPRLRAALLARGTGWMLRSADLTTSDGRKTWDGEVSTLVAAALPFGAAQCLTLITAPGTQPEVCGVPTVDAPAEVVPLVDEACTDGVRLGAGLSASGQAREVRLAPEDMLLHTEVIGSTGTGKSSLLAGLVSEARAAGFGVSVIDPHGHLVQRILGEMPAARAASVLAVRHGDPDRPVPVNPFAGRNPEMMTDVMTTVLRELHDPGNQGFMGPVWERWLGSCMMMQRELIGPRANLALLPDLVQEQARLSALVRDMKSTHPAAASEMSAIVTRKAEEYADVATWFVSKFQRMVGSPEMRGILGTGRDTVDVVDVIDRGQMLLVDLAAPILGDLGAQLVGEMWLAKHWEALAQRADPTRPHLLVVDEAHLFASGLLPRLLMQARKFGVAVVLAHQNLEQLTSGLREAVLASTNNVVVFRTGLKEAAAAHARLGSWSGGLLTRLPRLTAAATLSTGTGLTDAFTLTVDHNDRAGEPDTALADRIVEQTKRAAGLTDAQHPLTFQSLREAVRRTPRPEARPSGEGRSDFLDDWLARRQAAAATSQQD